MIPVQAQIVTHLPVFGATIISVSLHGICRMDFYPEECYSALAHPQPPFDLLLAKAVRQLQEYFQGERQKFDLAIDYTAMDSFQQQVLRLTCEIPFGSTRTYGELAETLAGRSRARAVGAALASNPIPILIPCHRVVSADGSLRGYSGPGGIETKAWLLQFEGARLLA